MNAKTLMAAVLIGATSALAACGQAPAPAETPLEHAAKHLDRGYVCPMHPDVTSDEPGTCPICGMELVPVETAPAATTDGDAGREPLYYRHPHDPTITSPVPRKDEMGMDFVPVYGDAAGDEAGVVRLSAAMTQNLGVRTAAARKGRVERPVETVGTVEFDDRGRVEVRVRAEGYVESLGVRAEGEQVRRGQRLFAVFSPRLAAAQREYLHALELGDKALIEASESRLQALGLGEPAIRELASSRKASARVTYYAPVGGVVTTLGVRDGGLAEPGASAMTLVPVDHLWVVAEVPESQAARVAAGQPARLSFEALPGERFEAKVIEVLPRLRTETRTLQARLEVHNPDGRLAAGMLADVVIETGPGPEAVLIPTEALIRTGRSERVVIALGEGRFTSRDVIAGRESGQEIEVRAGLSPGDVVVVSGQFMIDSESQVRQSLRRLDEPASGGPAMPAPEPAGGVTNGAPDGEGHPHHDHGHEPGQGT
jgi:Cu(I)/Ag(I) efflux system membrane fusion protein